MHHNRRSVSDSSGVFRLLAVRWPRYIALIVLIAASGCGGSYSYDGPPELTRAMLDESLQLGSQFLRNAQKPAGNFCYEINLTNGEISDDDHEVRQAAALWAVALIHYDSPSDETRASVLRGLDYFDEQSKTTDDGCKYIVYPSSKRGHTGTLALVTLALVEFLRAEPDHARAEPLRDDAQQYIQQLLSLRQDDGRFHGRFSQKTGKGTGKASPFYDGETLLALSKAMNYLDREDLESILPESAEAMYKAYFLTPRKNDDNKVPKQFYQWGSMAMLEICTSPIKDSRDYAAWATKMAHWMVDILPRKPTYNTGASYEGLISAWEIARLNDDKETQESIRSHVAEGLLPLLSWQVDGPAPNKYLREHPAVNDTVIGGVMSRPNKPELRIDLTQHQMNATILARRYLYKE